MSGQVQTTDYDLIVIGAGSTGENVADYATKRGVRVAIIEDELVGGECSYWACMPSKALLRSGHALRAARRLAGAKEAVTGSVDASALLARRTSFTDGWSDEGQAAWVKSAGIELIRGRGRLVGPGRIQVGDRVITAKAVALATGSVPVFPPIPGLADAAPWGTREATSADSVPERIIVIGGGVAGTELAFAFSSLGSQVTMLSRSALLEREEPFAGKYVTNALAADGVDVRIGATPVQVKRDADGIVTVTLDDGTSLQADELIVSTGRRPSTDGLGLETVDLDGAFTVDETMRVDGTDWLYAVGDVNGRALLTHQGKYQARAAGEAIAARLTGAAVDDAPWGQHVATADNVAVPRVVFSDPEVAAVGLTERAALESGLNVRAVEYNMGYVAGAKLHADGYTGRAKLVVDEDRHVVVGATFVGQDTAELLHAATIAIVGEVTINRLWHAVPAYPTISEIWLRLLETYGRA
ncbi:pyruvate/2-oxoglutarate dehydrogenase complex dihydrolipoamide dehydrogenase (E3) component [Microbacterium sp. W4I4]|uniref:dihydrolipoyl dehydrogenase family protein n=1 Tax=Microbacterium sp. W4I4 TaxID=3042295 RepID=UPI00277F18C7|nr:NAD(P)/FAD-dependent oxidoreductase [Microbacterium sp. W4I4]MDQ0615373.1 pyruvate/2-oxoglutarate dehydrogenase complex dihydrolipoamide dehydrogenase (E3) component [Microbacterium sp. W4I4]